MTDHELSEFRRIRASASNLSMEAKTRLIMALAAGILYQKTIENQQSAVQLQFGDDGLYVLAGAGPLAKFIQDIGNSISDASLEMSDGKKFVHEYGGHE